MEKKGFTEEEWKIVEKTIYQKMLEDERNIVYPEDSIVPLFENEIRNLGFEFKLGNQVETICNENPDLTKSIVLKYYKICNYADEKSYLMACLISPKNKDLISFFIEEFYNDYGARFEAMVGNCLMKTVDNKYLKEYLKMLEDIKLGNGRAYIIWTIEKLKSPEALPILIKLLNTDYLRASILRALNRYRDVSLLHIFEKYKDDKNTDIRNAAKKGIKTIEKIQNKSQN